MQKIVNDSKGGMVFALLYKIERGRVLYELCGSLSFLVKKKVL